MTVVISVVERAWLRVTVDGEVSYEGILPSGTIEQWVGREKIQLYCGNAGGVVVTVNGRTLGKLGDSQDVVIREWSVEQGPG